MHGWFNNLIQSLSSKLIFKILFIGKGIIIDEALGDLFGDYDPKKIFGLDYLR